MKKNKSLFILSITSNTHPYICIGKSTWISESKLKTGNAHTHPVPPEIFLKDANVKCCVSLDLVIKFKRSEQRIVITFNECKFKCVHEIRKLISQIQRSYPNRKYYNLNPSLLHEFTSKAPESYKALKCALFIFIL